MQNKTAEQVLKDAIYLLFYYLIELSDCSQQSSDQFAYGEKTAYTECLELLCEWEYSCIDDVEELFPL